MRFCLRSYWEKVNSGASNEDCVGNIKAIFLTEPWEFEKWTLGRKNLLKGAPARIRLTFTCK